MKKMFSHIYTQIKYAERPNQNISILFIDMLADTLKMKRKTLA